MRHTYRLTTPAQIRSFRLLTLAQMTHLENIGISMTGRSAKRQAMEALDLNHATGASLVEIGDLIEGLRDLAAKVTRIEGAEAPTLPIKPQHMEATL